MRRACASLCYIAGPGAAPAAAAPHAAAGGGAGAGGGAAGDGAGGAVVVVVVARVPRERAGVVERGQLFERVEREQDGPARGVDPVAAEARAQAAQDLSLIHI